VTELINAAGVCKTSVAEYYQSKGYMPATVTESGCSNGGTANSAPPTVAAGDIAVVAAGGLAGQLGAGNTLGYKAGCAAPPAAAVAPGGCAVAAGAVANPISAWFCDTAAGTNILPKYLPASCRT
jgi:type IV pilus assembly protein PilA